MKKDTYTYLLKQPLDSPDILNLSYDDYVEFLQQKYGIPEMPYFTKESYKSYLAEKTESFMHKPLKNRITRSSEGLFVHHVDEDKAIMLSTPEVCKQFGYPFKFQKPKHLCYCDAVEHLLLHIKIIEKDMKEHCRLMENLNVGIGGVNLICSTINGIYMDGEAYSYPWMNHIAEKIQDKEEEYLHLVSYFESIIHDKKFKKTFGTEDYSSFCYDLDPQWERVSLDFER